MRLLHRFPAVVTRSSHVTPHDAGLFAEQVEHYEVVGDARRFRVAVNAALLDGLSITAFSTTGHRARFLDTGTLSLIVAHRGRLLTENADGEIEVRGDLGAFRPPGVRTTSIPGPYVGLGLRVPLSRLAAHAAMGGGTGWRGDRPWPARPSPRLVRALRYTVRELDTGDTTPPPPRAARAMAQLLLDLLLLDLDNASDPERSASLAGLSQVRRAEELLRGRAADAVSLAAIAGELGISMRSLQAGFRRHRGVTPRAFLAARRF